MVYKEALRPYEEATEFSAINLKKAEDDLMGWQDRIKQQTALVDATLDPVQKAGQQATLDQLNAQAQQLEAAVKPNTGNLWRLNKQAELHKGIASATMHQKLQEHQIGERMEFLKSNGLPVEGDPVLESINTAIAQGAAGINGAAQMAKARAAAGWPQPEIPGIKPVPMGEPADIGLGGKISHIGGQPVEEIAAKYGSGRGPIDEKTQQARRDRLGELDRSMTLRTNLVPKLEEGINAEKNPEKKQKLIAERKEVTDSLAEMNAEANKLVTAHNQERFGKGEGKPTVESFQAIQKRVAEIDDTIKQSGANLDPKVQASLNEERDYLSQLSAQRLAKLPVAQQQKVIEATREPTGWEKTQAAIGNAAEQGGISSVHILQGLARLTTRAVQFTGPTAAAKLLSSLTGPQAKAIDDYANFERGIMEKARGGIDKLADWEKAAITQAHAPQTAVEAKAKESLPGQIGGIVGGIAPYAVAGAAGRLAGLGAAGETIISAASGSAGFGQSWRDEATRALEDQVKTGKLSADQFEKAKNQAEAIGQVAGAGMMVPFGQFTRILAKSTVGKAILSEVTDLLGSKGEKAVTEWLAGSEAKGMFRQAATAFPKDAAIGFGQQLANNLTARGDFGNVAYDPKRGTFEGTSESALTLGLFGAFHAALRGAEEGVPVEGKSRDQKINELQKALPEAFWTEAKMDAEGFTKKYTEAARRAAANQASPEDIDLVQRVNAAADAAGVSQADLFRGRKMAAGIQKEDGWGNITFTEGPKGTAKSTTRAETRAEEPGKAPEAAPKPPEEPAAPAAEPAPKEPTPPAPVEAEGKKLNPLPEGTEIKYVGKKYPVTEGIGTPVDHWEIKMPGETKTAGLTEEALNNLGYEAPSRQASTSKSPESFKIVKPGVLSVTEQSQILDPVVSLIPVDMMNKLGGKERATQVLLHDPAMLQKTLSSHPDIAVSRRIIGSLADSIAKLRAELPEAFSGGGNQERLATIRALELNLSKIRRSLTSDRGQSSNLEGDVTKPLTPLGTKFGGVSPVATDVERGTTKTTANSNQDFQETSGRSSAASTSKSGEPSHAIPKQGAGTIHVQSASENGPRVGGQNAVDQGATGEGREEGAGGEAGQGENAPAVPEGVKSFNEIERIDRMTPDEFNAHTKGGLTVVAKKLGESAVEDPKAIERLKELRDSEKEKSKATEDMDAMMHHGFRSQFWNDAYMAATKTGVFAPKPAEKPIETPKSEGKIETASDVVPPSGAKVTEIATEPKIKSTKAKTKTAQKSLASAQAFKTTKADLMSRIDDSLKMARSIDDVHDEAVQAAIKDNAYPQTGSDRQQAFIAQMAAEIARRKFGTVTIKSGNSSFTIVNTKEALERLRLLIKRQLKIGKPTDQTPSSTPVSQSKIIADYTNALRSGASEAEKRGIMDKMTEASLVYLGLSKDFVRNAPGSVITKEAAQELAQLKAGGKASRKIILTSLTPEAGLDKGISPEATQTAADAWRGKNPQSPKVEVVNDPNWTENGRGVRGQYKDGRIVINAAYATDASAVDEIANHEWAHHTLSTEQGRTALATFAGREIPAGELSALAAIYPAQPSENAFDHHIRVVEEWVAKNAEKNPSLWNRIVEAVRRWLARLGMTTITHAQAARTMLQSLRDRIRLADEETVGAAATRERIPRSSLSTENRDEPESFLARVTDSIKAAVRETRELPHYEGFNKIINEWTGRRQEGLGQTERAVHAMIRAVPDKLARQGISNWIDAGGDAKKLNEWAKAAKTPEIRKGYEAALNLTPEQIQFSQVARKWFKAMFEKGVGGGVIKEKSFLEDYITHIVKQKFVGGGPRSDYGGKIVGKFKYGMERTFPNFHELEEAGYEARTKDVAEIMAVYGTHLTNAIETRRLARALLSTRNAKGERLGKLILGRYNAEEGNKANYINDPAAAHEGDIFYKAVPHSAFRGWAWTGTSPETGKPIITQGEIGVHPDIFPQLENAIGRSEIRKWYDSPGGPAINLAKRAVKAFDISQSALKGTMLGGISTFHAVHEMKRALGNRVVVNPILLKPIDWTDERTKLMVRAGVMLIGDRAAEQAFSEGLGSRSLIDKIPGVGIVSRAVSDYTFHQLIPQLKWHAFNAIYERNLKLFGPEARPMDVAYLTAKQVNARFGHLNLADLNRDPTFQHLLGWGLLAPDFLESNVRNYGQDIKGLTGSKTGREPMKALAWTAAVIWVLARIINQLFDDDPHYDEPFSVVIGDRRYTMRNEAEDLWRLTHETGQFVSGRLNPTVQMADQLRTGRNWRGEKVTTTDTLKEFLAKGVPISGKALPGARQFVEWSATGKARTVSPFEEFLSSQGVQVSRVSALNDAYKLARDYRKSHGDKEDTGTYPVSRYQQTRYALEDKDPDRAKEESDKLIAEERQQQPKLTGEQAKAKIAAGFKASLNRPWTKTKEQDREFLHTLTREQKLIIMAANKHRDQIWKTFCSINHVPYTPLSD
jgi:hypothetical protein